MKLQNFTVIFVIILIPIILLMSMYITNGIKTIKYQSLYDAGLLNATHDAIYAFEQNTSNDEFSGNPEIKRDILKSSVKMFEKSLSNACNVSSYSTDEIEEYIPAIVFGMYDGFYMYAPSYNSITGKYEHSLKNYVYYSETLEGKGKDGSDVVITYSLDNYITVAGNFGHGYEIKKGYLMQINSSNINQSTGNEYAGITIKEENIKGEANSDGKKYYTMAFQFTHWFLEDSDLADVVIDGVKPFEISSTNDPENENSAFVKHKRKIIKEKIEGVLNSTITAYSERTWGQVYKMPKLLEEDLEKIYSNISMLTFFQGKSIGLTKYNGYCVANSTNSKEYVNPNLMYFTDGREYHDIRCDKCESVSNLNGYRIGAFEKKKVEELDASGNIVYEDGRVKYKYIYDHNELACYNCINGTLNTSTTVYEYVKPKNDGSDGTNNIKTAYWTSLGRERYDPNKITPIDLEIDVKFDANGAASTGIINLENYNKIYNFNEDIKFPNDDYSDEELRNNITRTGYTFYGWSEVEDELGKVESAKALTDITYYASWKPNSYEIVFDFDWEGRTATEICEYGSIVSLPSIPRRPRYNLVGWKNASGDQVDINNEIVYGPTTYYAIWELIEWDITFDYMDGRIETIKIPDGKNIKDYIENDYIENDILNPTSTDYVFKSWSADESNLSESTVNLEDQIANAEKTYYACWGYNVKFIRTAEDELDYVYAIGDKIDMPQNPELERHEFVAWEDESGNTVSTEQYATSHRTFTAVWRKKTYKIAFNLNGGTGDITTPIDVESGTNIPFPTSSEVSREGYELKGWSEDPKSATGITSATATKDATYYAVWEIKKYTIIFDYNDGTGRTQTEDNVIHGSAISFPSITRTGYDLIGWNTDSNAISGITSPRATEDTRYYAIWKDNIPPTITVTKNPEDWTNGNVTLTVSATDNISTIFEYSFDDGATWQSSNQKVYTANTNNIKVRAKDEAGNISDRVTVNITNIDKVSPVINSVTKNTTSWTNGDVTLTVNATDDLSGIKEYSFDGGRTWQSNNQKSYSSNTSNIRIYVRDNAGNISDVYNTTINNIDKVAPTITRAEYNSSTGKIVIQATDGESGIVQYLVGSNTVTASNGQTKEITISTSGTYTVTVKDRAGNTTSTSVAVTKKPVFVNGSKNLEITASGTGARYVKWDIVATGDVDLNLEIFIENSLASDVVKYEIEVVHVNTGEIRARGTLDSPTGTANISMTQRTTNGSIYIDYYIRIKAYNSAGEYTQKDATVWVSTTYAAGNTYAVGIQKNKPGGVNVGSKKVELNY